MLAQRERDSGSPTIFAFSSNGYKPVRWSWNQEGIDSIMSEFLNLENVLLSASGSFRAWENPVKNLKGGCGQEVQVCFLHYPPFSSPLAVPPRKKRNNLFIALWRGQRLWWFLCLQILFILYTCPSDHKADSNVNQVPVLYRESSEMLSKEVILLKGHLSLLLSLFFLFSFCLYQHLKENQIFSFHESWWLQVGNKQLWQMDFWNAVKYPVFM